jgi:hypothetical protein
MRRKRGRSKLRRVCDLVVLACLFAWATGCATGGLINLGRRTEHAVGLESAFTDGDQLWLEYRAEKRNRKKKLVGTSLRAVVLHIDDLDPQLGHPVDAFPLTRLSPEAIPGNTLRPVPLVEPSDQEYDAPCLVVTDGANMQDGFRAEHLEGAPDGAHFHSQALTDRDVAPWVLLLFPLALAWDAVTVPILAVASPLVWAWAQ